jgi:putative peptidoglycan lipid II flippase
MSETRKIKQHLIRSAGIMSGMTLLSRILGMLRDIFTAHIFGIGRVWDAFVFAFMIPNFLRRLLGEGALSSAFIPLYTELLNKNGEKDANAFTSIILSFLLIGLGAMLLFVDAIFAFVLAIFTLSEKVTLILGLLQLFSPYILILCVLAIAMGVLNCHKKFFVPSLMPIILNIGWILALSFVCLPFGSTNEERIYLLGIGILVVSIIQFFVQFIALYKTGFRFKFSLDFKHPFMGKLMTLMVPALLGFSMTQINVLVDQFMAYLVGDGANSALWYGNRVMQFPLGMFGIAMGTALLPTISHLTAQNNIEHMKDTLSFSLRLVLFIILPSTVGLVLLSNPIIRLLFQSGLFDARATMRAANTLMAYSFGLFAYSGMKLVVVSFYSLQDTKTPVKIGAMCMAMNIALNLILMIPFKEMGIAFATSISNTLNFIFLYFILEKKIGSIGNMRVPLLKIMTASVLMGAVVCFFSGRIVIDVFAWPKLNLCAHMAIMIVIAVVSYFAFCFALGIKEAYKGTEYFLSWFNKKIARERHAR